MKSTHEICQRKFGRVKEASKFKPLSALSVVLRLFISRLSVQIYIHGSRYNVVRTSVTNSSRRLVGHFFVLL